ncbi:MarR family winged helix-turn-helix transcriptional regulator [Noviherbaspirillum pedocola]|uniref:MarR family transcriptional regulator n=1 Tax=Noviherbaspirillum pedocola TaxID=2801341 RepID=A0A934SYP1_9BURK|nr:MarR family transcriptional regulator [Noviherbaspirillum pedocola]MBK4737735.1 MarR family transcriptional regulator [Noviherbaspirillum pedocola]
MPSIEERFSAVLYNASRAWKQTLDRRLKDLGIGQAGWLAITVAARADGPMSQTELARRLGVEDPTVVATVDRLVKAGYVARQPCAHDRRIKLVVLTEAGKALYEKVKTQADNVRTELLSRVDRQQLELVTAVLEAVLEQAESAD